MLRFIAVEICGVCDKSGRIRISQSQNMQFDRFLVFNSGILFKLDSKTNKNSDTE